MTLTLTDAHAPIFLVDGKECNDKTELSALALLVMQDVGIGDIRCFLMEMLRVYGEIIKTDFCDECKLPFITYEMKV